MNRRLKRNAWLIALMATAMSSGASVAIAADANIPVVPASVMKDAPKPISPKNSAARDGAASESSRPSSNTGNANAHLTVSPGVNEIVPVAVGHLNRVVTPFSQPQVTTTSAATTEIRNNVVYVGTDQEAPVTMFITQRDSEAQAISLTLVPQRIPPRELFLKMEGAGSQGYGLMDNRTAERWEASQPYVDTLRSLLRQVALGKTPSGYTFHEASQETRLQPQCQQRGLHIDFSQGQVMVGQNLTVSIGLAENVTRQTLEFKEASCGNWDVAAVAAWPRNVLAPAEQTEVYVVTRMDKQRPVTERRRPSLLVGGGR